MPVPGAVVAESPVNENRRTFRSSAGPVKPQQVTRTPLGRPARTARAELANTEHAGEDNGSWLPWPSVAQGCTGKTAVLTGFDRLHQDNDGRPPKPAYVDLAFVKV
jgi:hypothetical protein